MLFNSYIFIFLYLPVVLILFFWIARISHVSAASWLVIASLFFYGWWNPVYLGLLISSIICNYFFGLWIARTDVFTRRKAVLTISVGANLLLLAYYKYADFFLSSLGTLSGTQYSLSGTVLPLGISFFTFTQIAFLVDVYQKKAKEYNLIHYALFVSYFPHLIAGPVLHHKEMMPQFSLHSTYRFNYENMAVGLTIFSIGLFKKTFLADSIARYASAVFGAPAAGMHITFGEAWGGALSYAFQIYFDFSGYSDMAIGLSRMFGIILPLNFNSPYKSVNIIEFWRRWHVTLSRFLRDYLYFPLGGNRRGQARRYFNLMTTMLLGGLWHGAGWTFIIWGGLHGIYIVINHGWQAVRRRLGQDLNKPLSKPFHIASSLLTFFAVTVAWVFFRADTLDHALSIVRVMLGFDGIVLKSTNALVWQPAMRNVMLLMLPVVWLFPNTQQIMRNFNPALNLSADMPAGRLVWRPNLVWLLGYALVALFGVLSILEVSEFIYFRF